MIAPRCWAEHVLDSEHCCTKLCLGCCAQSICLHWLFLYSSKCHLFLFLHMLENWIIRTTWQFVDNVFTVFGTNNLIWMFILYYHNCLPTLILYKKIWPIYDFFVAKNIEKLGQTTEKKKISSSQYSLYTSNELWRQIYFCLLTFITLSSLDWKARKRDSTSAGKRIDPATFPPSRSAKNRVHKI